MSATRRYRPAIVAEGQSFDDAWCARCQRDAAWRDAANPAAEPCEILSRALACAIGDPDYPAEWIEDDVAWPQSSDPRCTAFLIIGADEELAAARADPRQPGLPL